MLSARQSLLADSKLNPTLQGAAKGIFQEWNQETKQALQALLLCLQDATITKMPAALWKAKPQQGGSAWLQSPGGLLTQR